MVAAARPVQVRRRADVVHAAVEREVDGHRRVVAAVVEEKLGGREEERTALGFVCLLVSWATRPGGGWRLGEGERDAPGVGLEGSVGGKGLVERK